MRRVLFIADGHQRKLPDHVGHYLQSLTPPASCDAHQDRLEQDPELQDRQGDAERLDTALRKNRPGQRTTVHDWIVVLSLYKNKIKLEIRGQKVKGLVSWSDVTLHIGCPNMYMLFSLI